MYDIADYMLDYIEENKLTDEYLQKINIPIDVILEQEKVDKDGFGIVFRLCDYLDELEEQMNIFLWEELYYKESWKRIEDIKLSVLIKKFELPLCPFWLTFCELVKTYFSERVYS